MFEGARVPLDPALDDLATALRIWCEANCAGWGSRQYEEDVSSTLAACLGRLRGVRTDEDCRRWLGVCKIVMGRVLSCP